MRENIWLLWNSRTCLEHRLNRTMNNWSRLVIDDKLYNARHTYILEAGDSHPSEESVYWAIWNQSLKLFKIARDFKNHSKLLQPQNRHLLYGPFNVNYALIFWRIAEIPQNGFHGKEKMIDTREWDHMRPLRFKYELLSNSWNL